MNQKTFVIAIEFEEQEGCDSCNIECLPDYLFGLLHADDERERKSPGYGGSPTYAFRDLTVYDTIGDLLSDMDDGSAQPSPERGEYEAKGIAYAVEGVAHVHFLGASMIRCDVYGDKASAMARARKEAEEVCRQYDEAEHEELPDGDGCLVKFKDGCPLSGKIATFFVVPQTYHA